MTPAQVIAIIKAHPATFEKIIVVIAADPSLVVALAEAGLGAL